MSQRRVRQILLLAGVAGLLALPAVSHLRPARFLAAHWHEEMKGLSEDELPLRLRQLAGLGEDGWTVVVEALDDPRPVVAEEARRTLHLQLDRWRTLNVEDSSPHVAGLAHVLADSSADAGTAARRASAGLATRILLWPIDRTRVDGAQLVADCERVLSLARQDHSSQADAGPPPRDEVAATAIRDYGTGLGQIESAATALPGGNLPIEIAAAASLPRRPTDYVVTPRPREPRRFQPASPLLQAVPAAGRPSAVPPITDQAVTEGHATQSTSPDQAQPERTPAAGHGATIAVPPPAPALGALADLEVMRALQEDDRTRAAAASHELTRRGFEQVHIEIARQLFDPDPRVRAKLIDALPRISGIDARPWLMVLSRDKDPALRRQVIGIFATSSDPALRQHLQDIEQVESDPEIRQAVRRILDLERR